MFLSDADHMFQNNEFFSYANGSYGILLTCTRKRSLFTSIALFKDDKKEKDCHLLA